MAKGSITFRIFVSSTFNDLREERNALQEKVFPRLRSFCNQNGARFQAIDLRWGVSDEAGLDQQTMRICLDEIERCKKETPRPNFILLLGDRYGWCPLPYEINVGEFEEILDYGNDEERNLLCQWYFRDDNAIPPNYVLQPRTGEYIYHEAWEPVEGAIRNIFEKAIENLRFPIEAKRKYITSATEQEIIKGALSLDPDSREHVFSFERQIDNLPLDETSWDYINIKNDGTLDSKAMEHLTALKEEINKKLPEKNIFKYSSKWTGNGITSDHIEQFCSDVYNSLYKVISEELMLLKKEDSLTMEIREHRNYSQELARNFMGREDELTEIKKYVMLGSDYPLVIFGDSGVGKSSLLAKIVSETIASTHSNLVYRFIGATPESTNGRNLLTGIYKEIGLLYNQEFNQIPTVYEELQKKFYKMLSLSTQECPLILIIDAIDQITDDSLKWLPSKLPPNVRIIISSLETDWLSKFIKLIPAEYILKLGSFNRESAEGLLSKWLEEAHRTLQPVQREWVLNSFDKSGLPLYLKLAFEECKKWHSYTKPIALPDNVRGLIRHLLKGLSDSTNHGHVLVSKSLSYLAAAKNGLSEDELLDVLSRDEDVLKDFLERSKHELTEKRLPVVVWSRLYLDIESYLTMRKADNASLITFFHRQFKDVICEEYMGEEAYSIHRSLAAYFNEQSLRLSQTSYTGSLNLRKLSELPIHQIFGQLWDDLPKTLHNLNFIQSKIEADMAYDLIADYNLAMRDPNYLDENDITRQFATFVSKQYYILSTFPELTIQQAYNQPNGSAPQLLADEFFAKEPKPVGRLKNKDDFEDRSILTIPAHMDNVSRCKWSQDEAKILSASGNQLKLWDATTGKELASLEGHEGKVADCNWSVDGLIASCDEDGNIIIWNNDGRKMQILQEQQDKRSSWSCCAWSPDGARLATGSSSGKIVIWDINQEVKPIELKGSDFGIDMCIWKDNSTLVTTSEFFIWILDLNNSKEILKLYSLIFSEKFNSIISNQNQSSKIFTVGNKNGIGIWDIEKGYREEIKFVISDYTNWAPDGKKVFSVLSDKRCAIWEYESGQVQFYLGEEPVKVCSSDWTLKGDKLVTGTEEGTLKVWDTKLNSQKPLGEAITMDLTKHYNRSMSKFFTRKKNSPGNSLSSAGIESEILMSWISPNGKFIVTSHKDKKLRIWNSETGEKLYILSGHKKEITKISWTSDSELIVSASRDKTLRVWQCHGGQIVRKLSGHEDYILDSVWSPDNVRVLSTSENGEIKLWNGPIGFELGVFHEHQERVNCCSWHPKGKLFCSGSDDRTIKIWDTTYKKSLNTLDYSTGRVTTCEWSPKGDFIAAGGSDNRIKVWSASGEQLVELAGHKNEILYLKWFSDSSKLVSLDKNSTIKVWDINSSKEIITWVSEVNLRMFVLKGINEIFALSREGSKLYNIDVLNIDSDIPVVTPRYCYDRLKNQFKENLVIDCKWCSAEESIDLNSLGLEILCSKCNEKLRINPFATVCEKLKP